MTDLAAIPELEAKIGPGRLVLVVGPSGAGKDTLLGLAQAALADDDDVVFVRRVVTREASAHENNVQVTPEAFRAAREDGAFAIDWDARALQRQLARTAQAAIARAPIVRLHPTAAEHRRQVAR